MVYATGVSYESCGVRGVLNRRLLSVVFSQLAMEHPHILLLGEEISAVSET